MNIHGIQSGAVLQRDGTDRCFVTLTADFTSPTCSHGRLTPLGSGRWRLTDIPVGGPYVLTFADGGESVTFTDVYVGDLWLLAGQSNMEGAGRLAPEEEYPAPDPLVRAFFMQYEWGPAEPFLHRLHRSPDAPHRASHENYTASLRERGLTVLDVPPYPPHRAAGPGYYFAREMLRLTGVPQGVIPAAVGGAPIEMWLPPTDNTENYYTAALRRLTATGNHLRGVFWAQGEGNSDAAGYPAKLETMRQGFCAHLQVDSLPLVQLQSFRCTLDCDNQESRQVWSRFREMQRQLPGRTEQLATVATNDLELDDCIHIAGDSHKIVGVRGARAMWHLVSGEGSPEPDLDRVYVTRDEYVPALFSTIHVVYKNVNTLRAAGVPSGFTLKKRDADGEPSLRMTSRMWLRGNEVCIRVEIPAETLPDYELWYGYGQHFYCNITDEQNRAIPAMGPIIPKGEIL